MDVNEEIKNKIISLQENNFHLSTYNNKFYTLSLN